MNSILQAQFHNLDQGTKDEQYEAIQQIMEAIEAPVDWSYEVWDKLVEDLGSRDHHRRSRAGQFLAGLAKSDPEQRMLKDFPALWAVTYDSKFVTARHTLLNLWKVGLAGPDQLKLVTGHLYERFVACTSEKNGSLIRYDILQGLRKLYDKVKEESIRQKTLELIELETDTKYRKKYRSVWKDLDM
jgi:hypothetical protein